MLRLSQKGAWLCSLLLFLPDEANPHSGNCFVALLVCFMCVSGCGVIWNAISVKSMAGRLVATPFQNVLVGKAMCAYIMYILGLIILQFVKPSPSGFRVLSLRACVRLRVPTSVCLCWMRFSEIHCGCARLVCALLRGSICV